MKDLERLAAFPDVVEAAIASAPESQLRVRAADGRFALVEHAWHLADLEVEGYGLRIDRLDRDANPSWPDFHGDVIAEERNYIMLPLRSALQRFRDARKVNVERLRAIDDWTRSGEHDGVGRVSVQRLVQMMEEHDEGHAGELRELLAELGLPPVEALTAGVRGPAPAPSATSV